MKARSNRTKEFLAILLQLNEANSHATLYGVDLSFAVNVWWVRRDEGGVQFSRTPEAAARKATTLSNLH